MLAFLEKHQTRGAGEPFDLKPHIVSGQDAALALVDHLAGSRALPAVVITPGPHSKPEALADLARRLAGFATIYSLDALAAQALVATLGKDRAVFGGAVRIYRPGFTFDADPLDHDLMIVSYLDRRLTNGRTLADEIARRILPEAGEPIVPTPPAKVRTVPVVEVPRGPTPQERIARLERELDDAREDNEDLREEVRRLNDALRQAKEEIKTLRAGMDEPGVLTTQIPGIPWALANPHGHPIELADHFADQLQSAARDGSLAAEVHRKMEAVLEAPETYGKDMRGARKGQRACYVANNYRLVWSVSARTVRFVVVVSKENPEYSPFGA